MKSIFVILKRNDIFRWEVENNGSIGKGVCFFDGWLILFLLLFLVLLLFLLLFVVLKLGIILFLWVFLLLLLVFVKLVVVCCWGFEFCFLGGMEDGEVFKLWLMMCWFVGWECSREGNIVELFVRKCVFFFVWKDVCDVRVL